MSLVQFLRILYARRLILLTALVSCLLAGAVMSQVLPKRYSARARVMLDLIKPDPVTGQVLGTQFLRAYTRTQIELIKDYQIAEQVVDQLGWANMPEVVQTYERRTDGSSDDIRRWLAKQIIAGTDARLIESSNIMEISFRSSNPDTARRIAGLVRDAYMNASLAYRQETAGKTADWYREQVNQAQALVRAAEAERAEFARAKGIVLQADNTDLETSRLQALSSQSAVVVSSAGPAGAPAAVSPSQSQLDSVSQQLEQAANTLGPRHPAFQALERQREVLERAVARERAVTRGAAAGNGANASAELNQAYERQKSKVVAQSDDMDVIRRMTRDIELKREQLAKVTERASDLRLQANVSETGLTPLGAPIASDTPDFPNVPLILAGSLGFGAALGVCLGLLVELLGRRVRSQEDLESASGSPVFAEIGATRKQHGAAYRKLVRFLAQRAQRGRAIPASAE
jgi:polysaccharide biosynthesis transport protein